MCGICRAVHAEDAEVTGLGQAVPSSRAEEDEEKLHGSGDLPNGGGGNASAQRNRTSRKRQSRVSVKVNDYTFSTLTRSLLPSGCSNPPGKDHFDMYDIFDRHLNMSEVTAKIHAIIALTLAACNSGTVKQY